MPYYNAAVTKLKSALKGQEGLKARQKLAQCKRTESPRRAGYWIPLKKSGLKAPPSFHFGATSRQKKVGGLLNKLMAATDKNGL